MSDFKETIIKECLDVLHKDEVKEEFKQLMRPLIDMLIKEKYHLVKRVFIEARSLI